MRHDTTVTLRQAIGMSVALVAVLAAPMAPAEAAPPENPVSSTAGTTTVIENAVEAPSITALRTTGILAGVAIGVAVLVGLWWHLVVRRRRD